MKENSRKDIQEVDKLIKKCDECKLNECINCEISWTEVVSIKKITDEYKKILKMNEVLLKENKELKNKIMEKELEIIGKEEYTKASMGEIIEQYYTANEDCIAKQRIEDIIDRIDYDIKKTKEIISKNTNIYTGERRNDYQIARLKAMNTKSLDIKKRLQKLLESEE